MTNPSTFREGEPLRRRFYIGSGGQIACIDAQNGETLWQKSLGGSMLSLLLFKDLLFAAGTGTAACLTTDGELRWQSKVPGLGEPVAMALDPGVPGGQLLLGGAGILFALGAGEGALQWKNELPGMGYNPICLRAPGLIATNATMCQLGKYMVMLENEQSDFSDSRR